MIDQKNLEQFNRIYDETYNNTLKFIVCKCSNMEDVNDILQETYLEIYNSIKKARPINDYNKYILGIAKNKIRKYYGLLYRFKELLFFSNNNNDIELFNNLKSDVDIEKIVIETLDIENIWKYLKTKKINIQKIFYLYYQLGLTIREIAIELNVSESYTKNCLYRTLKELQEFLGKDCD